MSDPRLVFDGVEDFVDGEHERGEVLYRLEGLERTRYENCERLSLIGKLLLIWISDSSSSFVLRLGVFSFVIAFGGTFHCFLQLDVGLSSG